MGSRYQAPVGLDGVQTFDLEVGDNQPYYMTDEKDYSVPVHGERRGIPHVELELRQDLVVAKAEQARWADRLARVLIEGVESLRDGSMP